MPNRLGKLLSLKLRITLFSLGISIFTLWTLSYFASRGLRNDAERVLGDQQYSTVSLVSAQINRELETRLEALQKVATKAGPSLHNGPVAAQAFLETNQALQLLFSGNLFMTDAHGIRVATTPYEQDRIGTDLSDRDYIQSALLGNKASVGKPIIARPFQKPVIAMAAPITDAKGKIIGSLSGFIDLTTSNFLNQIPDSHYGKTGYFLLVSSAHRLVITATEKDRVLSDLPAPGSIPALDRYISGFQGSAIYINHKNIEVLTSAKQIPSANWLLIASLPTSEAFAPIDDMYRFMWCATIILTLIAGGLTWLMARHQLQPLQTAVNLLNAHTDKQQPFTPLPVARSDEIGQLIDGFNQVLATLKQRESALIESETRFRVLHDASFGGLVIHENGKILECNQAFSDLTGYGLDELIGMDGYKLIAPESMETVLRRVATGYEHPYDVEGIRKDGTRYAMSIQGKNIPYKGRSVRVSEFRDISERKRNEAQIHRLAFYDRLTGLPNRALLRDTLAIALASSQQQHLDGAILFIDIDHFQRINDTQGREVGDLLLQHMAQRLSANVSGKSAVARIGSDQFVVLLERSDKTQTENAADHLLALLHRPYDLNRATMQCTVCIGIAMFGENANADTLLSQAELAMSSLKADRTGHLRFFDPQMQAELVEQAEVEGDLRQALLNGEFRLFYQIQVGADGTPIGVEGLLRWVHPMRGLVPPAEFIPMAEETGLIIPIGQWVIETACRQLEAWSSVPDLSHLTIAVNVSARQFHHANFVEQVLDTIECSRANPYQLKLELTEGVLLNDVERVIEKMTALKARGIRFSLDDFGTGYSSLSYLKRLPLDQLKIDQSFVRDVPADPNDVAIVRTVVALGQTLGLDVLAEGVETVDQKDFLADNGCLLYQGYCFSRPVPVEEFERFMLGE